VTEGVIGATAQLEVELAVVLRIDLLDLQRVTRRQAYGLRGPDLPGLDRGRATMTL